MPQVVPGVTDPTVSREELDQWIRSEPASRQAVRDVLMDGGEVGSLTNLAGDWAIRQSQIAGESLGLRERRMLSAEEANARFGIDGELKFDAPVSESEAAWRQEQKRDELGRKDILERNQSVGLLEGLGYAVAGAAVNDPLTIGLNVIPGVGAEGLAARLGLHSSTRLGAVGRGVAVGAAEGAVIGGVQEGATYGFAQNAGRDYDTGDLMLGVSANVILGAGVRGGLEGIGWRAPDVAPGRSGGRRVTRDAGAAAPPRPRADLGAGNPIGDLIRQRARAAGEDGDTAVTIAMLESRLDPRADNPASTASGVFQFMQGPRTAWAKYGGGDPFDAELNVTRGIRLLGENRASLRRALRREPEPWELYLAHQQGAGGARQLLGDPTRPAVDALRAAGVRSPVEAIRLNGGRADMTAGEFAGLWRRKFNEMGGIADAAAAPSPRFEPVFDPPPPAVELMTPEQRLGALSRALDDMAADRQVSVGPLIETELASGGRPRPALDEAPDAPVAIRARQLDGVGDDVAVTVRGTEVPVRYAIVEARDIVTSHDDDLIRNPAFPEALQPRDRGRAGSQARLLRMEKEFSPRRLMTSPDAESGAPILSREGVAESGNGRSIMLRRNYERGTPVAAAYRAELDRRGFDVSGFEQPVLVRLRSAPMDGASRARLAREMNGDVTERLSATEQAFADAATLDDTDLGLFAGGEITAVANDGFARRFIDKAGAGQENDLVDGATQRLSQAGVERVQAAMVARAYGDRSLVYALFETQSNTIKAIGKGLMGAAPDWARMRAASARGELAAGADTTEALTAAVALVRHARDNRLKLGELVEDWTDQDRLLGGESLSPATQSYLRAFFIDDGLKRPASAEAIATTLRETSNRALDTTPGPDIFGDTHAFDAATILERAARNAREATARADAGDAGARTGDRAGADRGGNEGLGREAPEGRGQGGLSGGRRPDPGEGAGSGPDREGLGSGPAKDPETQRLEDDVAALEAELDIYVQRGLIDAEDVAAIDAETRDPSLFDLVIETATACLMEGGE